MNRRSFFAALGAVCAAPWMPKPAVMTDTVSGIAIRFVQQFKNETVTMNFERMIGWGEIRPGERTNEHGDVVRLVEING